MAKKVLFSLIILVIGFSFWLFWPQNRSLLQSPQQKQAEEEVTPSTTLISYEDPSGFKFDYPDNLSISIQEVGDQAIYSSLQLYSKKTDGSLSVTVSDTKSTNISDWIKENNLSASANIKDTKIGSLAAKEIKTSDRLYLVAIDNGILFIFEMPKLNEKFWTPIFEKIASDFTFGAPESLANQAPSQSAIASEELIFFEGEETVE